MTLFLNDADEIEAFYFETSGVIPHYLQLSPGNVGLRFQVVTFDGVNLVWAKSDGHARWRDVMSERSLQLGYMINCAGSMTVRGKPGGASDALVWGPC